jgi:hypothetical protein
VERLRRLDGERHDAATIDAVTRHAYLELAGETSAESLPEMLERLLRARLDADGSTALTRSRCRRTVSRVTRFIPIRRSRST